MSARDAGDGELVMIVEDNDRNARLVRDVLVAHGYRTAIARSGRAALDMVPELRPHLVLLDIQLPDLDGVEVLARLRRITDLDDVPILAVTAFAMPGDEDRIRAGGFDGYLAKPLDIQGLAATVADALVARNG